MSTGLSIKIFDEIRSDIVNQIYKIGSKLPTERALSEKYDASRFAVREAIAMLSQSGFVETHPQSGTYIREYFSDGTLDTLVQSLRITGVIDRDVLTSLLKFRYVTETENAGDATLYITDLDILHLSNNLKAKQDNLMNVDMLAELDYDFHYKVTSISKNIISRLVFQSFKPIYYFFTEFFYSLEDTPRISLDLNHKLLDALKDKNKKASYDAMGEILKFGEGKIYQAIDSKDRLIVARQT